LTEAQTLFPGVQNIQELEIKYREFKNAQEKVKANIMQQTQSAVIQEQVLKNKNIKAQTDQIYANTTASNLQNTYNKSVLAAKTKAGNSSFKAQTVITELSLMQNKVLLEFKNKAAAGDFDKAGTGKKWLEDAFNKSGSPEKKELFSGGKLNKHLQRGLKLY